MIYDSIQDLISYGISSGLIAHEDTFVVRNGIMEALRLTEWHDPTGTSAETDIEKILEGIIGYAVENGIIADTANSRDLFDTKIMGILTPMPHEVGAKFRAEYEKSPEQATNWYYGFSKKLNYVRAGRIARDLKWTYPCEYGELDITINRSKPEKDPRDIAAARNAKKPAYPACQLCPENAGFAGNASHPARQNLRPIPMTVGGEAWQFQYSPYGYYNEHCIVFNEAHVPMKIDDAVFAKLFDIIARLPHYFVGSNADLPIVGGSILSHEHFQGGRYTFAMAKAPVETPFTLAAFPAVRAGTVKWPMSVIRLASADRAQLEKACAHILAKWRAYSDAPAGIFAETDGVPHNTITPIARMNGTDYECDLVLRNNITSAERPLGIFHPRPELHHIKKENIGLIEVMGLAVLPSRLAEELKAVERALLSRADLAADPLTAPHAEWAAGILARHPELDAGNAERIIRQETGAVFAEVLADAGVFKRDAAGLAAFARFVEACT